MVRCVFFALATLLNLPSEMLPQVLLLDEPELGLHPAAVSLVGDMIRSLAAERQVIVATQSPLLVDTFDIDEIIALNLTKGKTEPSCLDQDRFRKLLDEFHRRRTLAEEPARWPSLDSNRSRRRGKQTEVEFVRRVLSPHLEGRSVTTTPILPGRGRSGRGGNVSVEHFTADVDGAYQLTIASGDRGMAIRGERTDTSRQSKGFEGVHTGLTTGQIAVLRSTIRMCSASDLVSDGPGVEPRSGLRLSPL